MGFDIHGVQIPIRPHEVSSEIWSALQSGQYELNEARRIGRAIQPNDRVLELGAGLGVITSLIASIQGVRVWSFEADPVTAELARRVIETNGNDNVTLTNGILAPGPARKVEFFQRTDFWMSSRFAGQGPYERVIEVASCDIDTFLDAHGINVLVMDIEGSELELIQKARLPGIERVFLELHDHLYGLSGVGAISEALGRKGLIYDPRGSSGPCVLYSIDDGERQFDAEIAHGV
jgi:FkbM family methyltransferase